MEQPDSQPGANRWLTLAACCFLAALVFQGVIGLLYARGLVDDVCLEAYARNRGLVGAVSWQYWTWSGNVIGLYYQYTGAVFHLYNVAPMFLLALWVASFSWFAFELLASTGLSRNRTLAVLSGAVLTLALVDTSPNIGQTLYWLNGTANYGPTAALFILLLALLLRVQRLGARRTHILAAVLLAFLTVCGQITMVLYCVGLLVPVLLAAFFSRQLPHRADLLRVLIFALAAGAIGAAIVILTPGNELRQAVLDRFSPPRLGFFGSIVRTLLYSLWMFGLSFAILSPVAHIVLLAAGYLCGRIFRPPALHGRTLPPAFRWAVVLGGFLAGWYLFSLGQFAATYAGSVPGPPRAWVVPQSGWMIVVPLIGYLYALGSRPAPPQKTRAMQNIAAVLLSGYLAFQVASLIPLAQTSADFAREYDARIALIEAAKARGETAVVVPPYWNPVGRWLRMPDREDAACLQLYYKLESLEIRTPE